MFLEDCPGRMAAIKAAVEQGDANALCTAAHTLKGSAGLPRGRVCRRRRGAARAPRARRPPRGRSGRGGSTGGRGGPARAGNPARVAGIMRIGRLIATAAAALIVVLAGQAAGAPPHVRSVRLYVFDCGVLKRGEPTAYGLTRSQVGSTDFADPCYLVVHPRGTLLWDVGIIPDDQIKAGGVEQSGRQGHQHRHDDAAQPAEGHRVLGRATSRISRCRTGTRITSPTRTSTPVPRCCSRRPSGTSCSAPRRRRLPFFPTYSALESSKTVQARRRPRRLRRRNRRPEVDAGPHARSSVAVREAGENGSRSVDRRPLSLRRREDDEHVPVRGQHRTDGGVARRRSTSSSRETGAQLWIQHDIQTNATLKQSPQYYD